MVHMAAYSEEGSTVSSRCLTEAMTFTSSLGFRGSCSVRSSTGASRPVHPKPYQPQSLNPPAFTHQLAEKIPWVWKPKRMLFVQLGSAPRANRQFKWVSDSNCAGNPKSGTITYCLLHSTTSRPATWGWGNGRQRGVELLQGENRENEGPISQQDPWGYNSSITGSLSYTKATSPRHQIK